MPAPATSASFVPTLNLNTTLIIIIVVVVIILSYRHHHHLISSQHRSVVRRRHEDRIALPAIHSIVRLAVWSAFLHGTTIF
jgi:hypothetical protein